MTMKRSFFERLSGSSSLEDTFDSFDDELPSSTIPLQNSTRNRVDNTISHATGNGDDVTTNTAGQLPIDVHQTTSDIIIRAFVAGVRPDELNISISRDMVEIAGSRAEREQIAGPDYFNRELFWGSFSRTILLPQEIDVEACSASSKDGLLTLILPKLDKAKQTKLRVKAG